MEIKWHMETYIVLFYLACRAFHYDILRDHSVHHFVLSIPGLHSTIRSTRLTRMTFLYMKDAEYMKPSPYKPASLYSYTSHRMQL